MKKENMKRLLTQEEKESERNKAIIFSFIVVLIGTYGFLIDSYDDGKPVIPNVINLIFNRDIIPDEEQMFDESYYIKNQSMSPILINGHYTVAYNIGKQKENKINGMFFYMILCFLPLFIIALGDFHIDKISLKGIKRKKRE